ncbi:GLPGLI family protein [Epilithonimonas sp. JDS]|uniref:GLPGLI family protein n=1 Tax=Epilithonimonas sp. JDS TaxID=2902797 RepID=UPI001E3ECFA3|nr:GLPGLI family protein [Epilithonimonas sp. JDS]MCD9853238.1 GLPGLI family protein [Epilithonimonas sp. JDS]
MKQLLQFLFLLSFTLFLSQNQRFYYDYQFQTDSTDSQTKKSELMVLDIDKKGSKYYSEYVFQNDSLMNAHFAKNTATHSDDPFPMSGKEGVITYKILKSYPDFRINHIMTLDMTLYNASQQVKMNWKILPEKDKIGDWSIQKAETDFAGRHWIAWFSSEIPVQDGPYKFHGLPGLIVKLEDKSGYYKFELKGIKNNILERNILVSEWEKPILIDYKKYQTIYKNYRKDPTANFRRKSQEGEVYMTDDAGNKINMSEMIKSQERQALEQIKKNNNVLELDLLK